MYVERRLNFVSLLLFNCICCSILIGHFHHSMPLNPQRSLLSIHMQQRPNYGNQRSPQIHHSGGKHDRPKVVSQIEQKVVPPPVTKVEPASWHLLLLVKDENSYKYAETLKPAFFEAGFSNITVWSQKLVFRSQWYVDNLSLFSKLHRILGKPDHHIHGIWKPMIILNATVHMKPFDWIFLLELSFLNEAVILPAASRFKTDVLPLLAKSALANGVHMCDCIPMTLSANSLLSYFSQKNLTNLMRTTDMLAVPCQKMNRWSVGNFDWSVWRNTYKTRRSLNSWWEMMINEEFWKQLQSMTKELSPSQLDVLASTFFVAKYNLKSFSWSPNRDNQRLLGDQYDKIIGQSANSLFAISANSEQLQALLSSGRMRFLHEWGSADISNCSVLNTLPPSDKPLNKVAVCLMGLPGSSNASVADSWRKNVLDVLQADLFIVSTGWPAEHWQIKATAYMNDDIDIVPFFDEHAPNWRRSVTGDNYLNGLPGFAPGSGAFQVASRYWCSKLINETEATTRRGIPYDYVGVGRLDLMWPNPHPTLGELAQLHPTAFSFPNSTSTVAAGACWVPCLRNDWKGVCDQYVFCHRAHAAAAALTGLLDVLPASGRPMNTERHLGRSLAHFRIPVARSDVYFIRTCEDPMLTGVINPKCGFASKLGVFGKISGGQIDIYK